MLTTTLPKSKMILVTLGISQWSSVFSLKSMGQVFLSMTNTTVLKQLLFKNITRQALFSNHVILRVQRNSL